MDIGFLNQFRVSNLRFFCDIPYRKNILIFLSKCGKTSMFFKSTTYAKCLEIEKVLKFILIETAYIKSPQRCRKINPFASFLVFSKILSNINPLTGSPVTGILWPARNSKRVQLRLTWPSVALGCNYCQGLELHSSQCDNWISNSIGAHRLAQIRNTD